MIAIARIWTDCTAGTIELMVWIVWLNSVCLTSGESASLCRLTARFLMSSNVLPKNYRSPRGQLQTMPFPYLGRLYKQPRPDALSGTFLQIRLDAIRRQPSRGFRTSEASPKTGIYLTYLARQTQSSNDLIQALMARSFSEALVAQRNFSAANNPMQPVLGVGMSAAKSAQEKWKTRDKLNEAWKRHGRPRIPRVLDLAQEVGLVFTYEYLYFATSNFVHFNPQTLLRMGGGPPKGPFKFSISHFDGYYGSFASFYGAVLFIGFNAAFGSTFWKADLRNEINRLIYLIAHIERWPEIVTFEEMNQRKPLYLLTHALGRVMRESKEGDHDAILKEVQLLGVRQ